MESRWMTIIVREGKAEVHVWKDEWSARDYFSIASQGWSESFLCKLVEGPPKKDMPGYSVQEMPEGIKHTTSTGQKVLFGDWCKHDGHLCEKWDRQDPMEPGCGDALCLRLLRKAALPVPKKGFPKEGFVDTYRQMLKKLIG